MLRRLWKQPFYITGTFSIHTCVYMMRIVLVFGRVKWLGWGGWGSFFSLESGTVRAVRALNRQRIMEIKAERLANGNIMATDCLGQLGHANEAAIEEESIRMEVLALYQRWCTDIHVYAHTSTHIHSHTEWGPEASRQEWAFSERTRLKWGTGDIASSGPGSLSLMSTSSMWFTPSPGPRPHWHSTEMQMRVQPRSPRSIKYLFIPPWPQNRTNVLVDNQ